MIHLIRCCFALILAGTLAIVSISPAQAARKIDPHLEEQVLEILRQHPDVIVESVQSYQQQQQAEFQKAQKAILQEIKTNPQTIAANSPVTGAGDFAITLFEFSDFQCPYCAQAQKTVKTFLSQHPEVTLVYKYLPLAAIHPQAIPAATAAWAAAQQGKFWPYQEALFAQQNQLGEELYNTLAKKLNLDLEKFKSDRNLAEPALQADIEFAFNLGVTGTPFFVLNGEPLTGAVELVDLEQLLSRVKTS